MKVTVMLGNGFDASLGLETSYSSFYEWYCPQESGKDHISKFRKEIDDEVHSNIPDKDKLWSDFEIGLGKYTKKFTKDTVNDYLECYEDAQEKMVKYLKGEQEKFIIENVTDKSLIAFQNSICNFYECTSDLEKIEIDYVRDKYKGENCEVSFITFNYTDTIERILGRIGTKKINSWNNGSNSFGYIFNKNVIHAHGTLDSFSVIGVNDESQIENKELLETPQFKQFLIKSENVVALGELWHRKVEEQISSSKFVCIFGMSLGETDAKWWRKIVQWLIADTSRHVIIYWHEKNAPNNVRSITYLQCKERAKEKLLAYSGLSSADKETLKKRIHVVINTDKFMKLEIEENSKSRLTEIEEALAAI